MRALSSGPLPGTTIDPRYPDSDGRPMGESDFHTIALIALREAFEDFFADNQNVYIASQLLFYFVQGNPSGKRDPDLLIALNVGNHRRRSFRVWEEGMVPDVFFEISSESTWQEDLVNKRNLYESLGISEYFLFDAEGLWLNPTFQGFRLTNGVYVPIQPGPDGSLTSLKLGVRLLPEDHLLRVINSKTGVIVPSRQERAEQAEEAEEAARLAEEAARLAKRRAEKAEAQLRRARLKEKEEHDRAESLAAEVERLRAQLKKDEPPTT
jgi:Uma2 family endonuclease